MANLQNYWTPVRNIPIPFVADELWQNTQNVDTFRADAGGHLIVAKPDSSGTIELTTLYLDSDNAVVPPAQNARLNVQVVEGILVDELPDPVAGQAKPNAPIAIPIPPALMNYGAAVEVRGEEVLISSLPIRALTFIGFQAVSLSNPPVGADKVIILARYS